MAATYRALCAHGYADLTMQRIADEAGKSKSLLHYHYGTKQELLVAFLDYLFDRFEARVAATEGDAPTSAYGRSSTVLDEPDDACVEFGEQQLHPRRRARRAWLSRAAHEVRR